MFFKNPVYFSQQRMGLLLVSLMVMAYTGMAAVVPPAGVSPFAAEFYQQCAAVKSGNVIVSPLSVATAIGLLSQGANGNTFDEIKQVLHVGNDKSSIANYFHGSHGTLVKSAGKSIFTIANQIYVKDGLEIQKDFKDVAVTKFDSGIVNIDFVNSGQAASTINTFVAEKTNNKITDMVKPSSVGPDTKLVLVNAIYFKGDWAVPFEKSRTSKDKFFRTESSSVDVEYMVANKKMNFAFLDDMDAVMLEMKYADSSFSFIGVLPKTRTGVSTLETKLGTSNLAAIIDTMYEREVDIKMPKFKAECEIELNDVLTKMGMGEMFLDQANLSGLVKTHTPLKITEAVHKAYIEINEEGTEAAASTAIFVGFTSSLGPTRKAEFHADHPFTYYIWDRDSHSVVFQGRYSAE